MWPSSGHQRSAGEMKIPLWELDITLGRCTLHPICGLNWHKSDLTSFWSSSLTFPSWPLASSGRSQWGPITFVSNQPPNSMLRGIFSQSLVQIPQRTFHFTSWPMVTTGRSQWGQITFWSNQPPNRMPRGIFYQSLVRIRRIRCVTKSDLWWPVPGQGGDLRLYGPFNLGSGGQDAQVYQVSAKSHRGLFPHALGAMSFGCLMKYSNVFPTILFEIIAIDYIMEVFIPFHPNYHQSYIFKYFQTQTQTM